jgi:hypothetical protein
MPRAFPAAISACKPTMKDRPFNSGTSGLAAKHLPKKKKESDGT